MDLQLAFHSEPQEVDISVTRVSALERRGLANPSATVAKEVTSAS